MDKPSAADKAYIKKHKVNDILNELFLSFTKEKPDDPIEYAYTFFEAKLPPEKKKRHSISSVESNKENSSPQKAPLLSLGSAGGGLGQIFSKSNLENLLKGNNTSGSPAAAPVGNTSGNDSQASHNFSFGGENSPFKNIRIVDKMHRILVQKSRELSEEELLKQEEIQVFTRAYEDEEPEELRNEFKFKRVANTRKGIMSQNKANILNVIKEEREKLKEITAAEAVDVSEINKVEDVREQEQEHLDALAIERRDRSVLVDDEEKEQLEREMFMSLPARRPPKAEKKKLRHIRRALRATTDGKPQNVQLVICKNCAQVQTEWDTMDGGLNSRRDTFQSLSPAAADQTMLSSLKKSVADNNTSATPLPDEPKGTESLVFERKVAAPPLQGRMLPADAPADDDNIESASQVSGPRGPLPPFEAETFRSLNKETRGSGGILAWVMARQVGGGDQTPRNTSLHDTSIQKPDNASSVKSIVIDRQEPQDSESQQQIWKNNDNSMSSSSSTVTASRLSKQSST